MALLSGWMLVTLGIVYLMVKLIKWYFTEPKNPNPFGRDHTEPLKDLELNQKKRDAVLKQGITREKIPDDLDAVVVGSGIGGLAAAAIMARAGKKVLVLEQHDQAGGCCHTYIEKGYEFDVGIHYIGEMKTQTVSKTLIDQITCGQLQWATLQDAFDVVAFDEEGKDIRKYDVLQGKGVWQKKLKEDFPEEADNIDRFFDTMEEVRTSHFRSTLVKFIPFWVVSLLDTLGLAGLISKTFTWNNKTVEQVGKEFFTNQELRDILAYNFGDYGTCPSKAGFPIQVLLHTHFMRGASYPVGGASEIAYHIIPVIEAAGGKVLVRAPVSKILVDDDGAVCGVEVNKGSEPITIPTRMVLSDAGLYNTLETLLPRDIACQSRLWPLTKTLPHAFALTSIFVGIDAPKEELDILDRQNMWLFNGNNLDKITTDYLKLTREEALEKDVPLLFISFPSTKDPEWENRYPGKTTLAIVSIARYEWFEEWVDKRVMKRGDDYEYIKKVIGQKMIDQTVKLFPKIKDRIDYVSFSSPISNNHYINAPRGEVYGLDHTRGRFSATNSAILRPQTDIPGLFMCGQDVLACGFTGAMWGGCLCAGAALERNVFNDLAGFHKATKRKLKAE